MNAKFRKTRRQESKTGAKDASSPVATCHSGAIRDRPLTPKHLLTMGLPAFTFTTAATRRQIQAAARGRVGITP
ncbi:MAG: hypothetical protein KGJ94_03400 [Xanthomonadaceae bacterium]|nr:hypothetical protein [Xanthomonadaceae bacterium]